jgi:hypothetical protein
MTATNKALASESLNLALESLAIRLLENNAEPVEIVVCGGSALILTRLIPRTTKDVDIVALCRNGVLFSPDPMPDCLVKAAKECAEDLGLPINWLNNDPSKGEGGLFQMGLPSGFSDRLHSKRYGPRLVVHCIDRLDQIHFKLYAAVDSGGYHIEDLLELKPLSSELESAARWTMSHDVSEGFASELKKLLRKLGYENVTDRL